MEDYQIMDFKDVEQIVYLGPDGSYTSLAKNEFLKMFVLKDIKAKPMPQIKSVLEYIDNNKNSLAVLPIENSIEGIVRETVDNLLKLKNTDIQIISEISLDINHCLVGNAVDLESVKTVLSHPQALAQCSNFLHKNLSGSKLIEQSSTSAAAKMLLELDDSFCAIANEYVANDLGLGILAKDINDEKDNKTRFILIGNVKTHSTGADKTSIAFSTKNVSGALCQVLSVFDEFGLNLSYIDSRPSKKNLGEYNFFVDFEGHIEDEIVKKALEKIMPLVNFYRLIGSFPRRAGF